MKLHLAAGLGLILLLCAPTLFAAGGPTELPTDLQELLPADPAVLVTIASFDDFQARWNELAAAFPDEDDDEDEVPDLSAMMAENLPRFEEIVDTARPLALALDLTPVMMGQDPLLTWVVPLKKSFTDREDLGLDTANSSSVVQGDYAAIHSAPGYLPGGAKPALAGDLVPGVVSAALDLAGLMQTYGPFVEMGLASIPVGVAETDTLPDGQVVESPGMTQEEADALKGMIRALMTSVDRFDLGFGGTGNLMRLDTRLSVLPDSPLSPGPQPDFARALAMTGMLPAGGDFLMAIAMDMTKQFDVFKDFYVLNLQREAGKLGPETGEKYAAWFRDYLDAYEIWAKPLAASYRFGEDGMIVHAVMESADAAGDVTRIAGIIEGLSEVGMGMTLTPLPDAEVGGVAVKSWSIAFDPETMTGLAGGPANPQLSGMGRMQAEQVTAILQKVVPGLSLAATDGYVLLAADDDPARLAGMIEAAGRGGKPDAEVARVAKAAGPGVQEVVTGDLLAILKWVTVFMEDADRDEMAMVMNNPIPFDGTYTIDGRKFGFAMSMDLVAVQNLIRALDEMDLDEQMTGGHGDEGEGD